MKHEIGFQRKKTRTESVLTMMLIGKHKQFNLTNFFEAIIQGKSGKQAD